MKLRAVCLAFALLPALGVPAKAADVRLELVGEVSNSPTGVTPATSAQYGYLSYVLGLPVFRSEPANETTALYTFYAQAITIRVLPDGPLRIITRVGTFTVYRHPALSSNFDDPSSFRSGTPVLVAVFRQQVVVDTVAQTFTTLNRNTIESTRPFTAGAKTVRLGAAGGSFNTVLTGHLNMPGPPSGYFAGYTIQTH
jgi:hypothetical protein